MAPDGDADRAALPGAASFPGDRASALVTKDVWDQLAIDGGTVDLSRQRSSASGEPQSPPAADDSMPPPRGFDLYGGGQKRNRTTASLSSVGAGRHAARGVARLRMHHTYTG